MNSSPYKLIQNLFEPIYMKHIGTNFEINDFALFSDYVKKVYTDISDEKYKNAVSMSTKLMNISECEIDDLILEVIFSNLYEYLILIAQLLNGKGMRHESFLILLDLPEDEYKKYRERFRKRMQPKRLQAKGIRSFKKVYSTDDKAIKYYIPNFIKAYKDVIFVPRQGTDILDISPYYLDIFTALMYENETDSCDAEYKNNRDLIKAYKIWDFSNRTIIQIKNIYSMIINSKYEQSDTFAQFLFIEKLFGLASMSELLRKECTKTEYIEIASHISKMTYLGYSTLHKTIIDKIDIETMRGYYHMIEEYIYPICTECMVKCINEIINYIGTLNSETRINKVNEFCDICRDSIKNLSWMLEDDTYDIMKRIDRIKKYRIKNLGDKFSVQLMKALVYQYTNKSNRNEIKQCIELLREDYTYDYNITDKEKNKVWDSGVANITFGEWYAEEDILFDEPDKTCIRYGQK